MYVGLTTLLVHNVTLDKVTVMLDVGLAATSGIEVLAKFPCVLSTPTAVTMTLSIFVIAVPTPGCSIMGDRATTSVNVEKGEVFTSVSVLVTPSVIVATSVAAGLDKAIEPIPVIVLVGSVAMTLVTAESTIVDDSPTA